MIELFGKRLKDIKPEDLQTLRANKVIESKTVEYKLILKLVTEKEKLKFLCGVTALANTMGGTIFIGIKAVDGIPEEIIGIPIEEVDGLKQQIENSLRDCVSPRIFFYQLEHIKLDEKRCVVVLQIPVSFNKPHMVTYGGSQLFYARNNSGKYPMGIDEIRHSFISGSEVVQRANDLRKKRVDSFLGGLTNLDHCTSLPTVILHIMPLSVVNVPPLIDFSTIDEFSGQLKLLHMHPSGYRYTFDGFLGYWFQRNPPDGLGSSAQLMREGYVEAIDSSMLSPFGKDEKQIPYVLFEQEIIQKTISSIKLLNRLDYHPPCVVYLSLLNVKGMRMATDGMRYFPNPNNTINKEHLNVPGVLVQSVDEEMPKALKASFDVIWNACGFQQSLNYDQNGNWNPRQ